MSYIKEYQACVHALVFILGDKVIGSGPPSSSMAGPVLIGMKEASAEK